MFLIGILSGILLVFAAVVSGDSDDFTSQSR